MSRLSQTVAVVALCAVASACNSTSGTPQDPAIGMAREIGRALPLVQYEAFADGVITFDEVETAADRLRACASDGGVTSFTATVREIGDVYESSYSGAPGEYAVIERCELEHLRATIDVFQLQILRESTP